LGRGKGKKGGGTDKRGPTSVIKRKEKGGEGKKTKLKKRSLTRKKAGKKRGERDRGKSGGRR